MKIDIVKTLDGSDTLYLEEIDEHYHSTFGAVQESLHVFIEAGFYHCDLMELSILEIGFGTGLNCYLTLLASLKSQKFVKYYALEKYPLPQELWSHLNYCPDDEIESDNMFSEIHQTQWNCDTGIHSQFVLHKIHDDLLNWDTEYLPRFDLVYFDAFSPEKQPELWDKAVFEGISQKMNPNAILVTYCAKGNVRRILQSLGFLVERLPGPPGKREMLRAKKV